MTRYMIDDLFPNRIPLYIPTSDLIAAYVGHAGNPDSYAQACQRFPGHQIVSIASHNAVDAQILDVEHNAVEPTDFSTMNAWCDRQWQRGVMPTIYCNTSTWPSVASGLHFAVNWWAANWSGGPVIPAGAVGIQYGSVGLSDISLMQDYIEGIDMTQPAPLDPQLVALLTNIELNGAATNTNLSAILAELQKLTAAVPAPLTPGHFDFVANGTIVASTPAAPAAPAVQ